MFKTEQYKKNLNFILDDFQYDLIKNLNTYFSSKQNLRKTFLVNIPMGGGKSHLISLMACIENGPILILSPFDEIKTMLIKKTSEAVKNLKIEKNIHDDINATSKFSNGDIYIVTYHKIHSLFKTDRVLYKKVSKQIKLSLVDEGHREPSSQWSFSVRSLNAAKLLFTATPYRNDFNIFEIEKDATFIRTYHQLREMTRNSKPILREVEFEHVPSSATNDRKKIELFLSVYEKYCKKGDYKAIIRCTYKPDIVKLTYLINEISKKPIAAGVHSSFESGSHSKEHLYNYYPDSDEKGYAIFIHQYILTEGVDEPRFRLLYFYDDFKNDRSIVQQIGRVLRYWKSETAYVLANEFSVIEDTWKNYIKYDAALTEKPRLWGLKDFSAEYLKEVTSIIYGADHFQEIFKTNLNSKEIFENIRLHKSANIFVDYDYTSESFEDDVILFEQEYAESQKIFRLRKSDAKIDSPYLKKCDDFYILFYMQANQSPVLKNIFFPELELHMSGIFSYKKHLYIYTSKRRSHSDLQKKYKHLNQDRLFNIIGEKPKYNYITVNNLDIGEQAIRQRAIRANNLTDSLTSNLDYSYYISNMVFKGDIGRNYVGMTSGRLKDLNSIMVNLDEYLKWIDSISTNLNSPTKTEPAFFKRFAKVLDYDSKLIPKYILLDFYQIDSFQDSHDADNLEHMENMEVAFEILESPAAEKKFGGYFFKFKSNENEFKVYVDVDADGKVDLNLLLGKVKLPEEKLEALNSLFSEINSRKAFRMTFVNSLIVYSSGMYLQARDLGNLNTLIYGTKELNTPLTEKGLEKLTSKKAYSDWQPSLFSHIWEAKKNGSRLQRDLSNIDCIFCDDRGGQNSEIADFIALEQSAGSKRIILIHCKSKIKNKKRVNTSATSLYDVTSQVIKNLRFLNPLNGGFPYTKADRFKNSTLRNDKVKGTYNVERLKWLKGKKDRTYKDFIRMYDELLADPQTIKECAIVICGGANEEEFKEMLGKTNIPDYLSQARFLLYSTWASVSSANATLKIYCPDEKAT